MKRTIAIFLSLALMLALTACGSAGQGTTDFEPTPTPQESTPASAASETAPEDTTPPESETPGETDDEETSDGNKILIAYFSATNNTENIANHLNEILDADLYEIVPETPYTSDDLNYNDQSSRSSQEMNDPAARPAISGGVDNMEQYDVVFLGYPIWWGEAPRIISTFLESYDLGGKTIVPFCTSGSSGIGSSATNLHPLAPAATWLDGQRFSGGASVSDVQSWVDSLDLEI